MVRRFLCLAPAPGVAGLLLGGCAVECLPEDLEAGVERECRVPGWHGRNVLVRPPAGWDGGSLPLVVAFHGGGGKKENTNRITCPGGDESEEGCLSGVADREGFALVSPDGTPSFLGSYRSWNAGGGEDGFLCVFGKACKQDVDDIAYVDDLLDLVADLLPVEADRIYATGLSNGAAISHRLACERADRFAGIAAIGGTNQAETAPGCDPVRPIPVLQVHGTEDPCWGYDGTAGSCAGDGANGDFLSVDDSMAGWASRLGCVGDPVETDLPDPADDGTTATLAEWPGCSARLARVRIEGGGHTWPGGWGWRDETKIGRVSQDIAGSDLVWDFLDGGR